MAVFGVAARRAVIAAATLLALAAAGPGEAKPMKFGQRTSDCKSWDCQGGIICSCCFFNGCWICDRDFGDKPILDQCHWEDAASTTQPPASFPPALAPGGTQRRSN